MSASDSHLGRAAAAAPTASELQGLVRRNLPIGTVWFLGSAVVVGAQPGLDRRLAAAGAVVVGIGAILVVTRTTADPGTRYLRALLAGIIGVSIAAVWLLRSLTHADMSGGTSFLIDGQAKRITLPLMFVLLAPLVVQQLPTLRLRSLWQGRAALWRRASGLDRIFIAYATVITLPALLYGLSQHNHLTFVAQDLGLVVFFTFMYIAGRAVGTTAARGFAAEIVDVLLLLAVTDFLVLTWTVSPLYNYQDAACAGAVAVVVLRRDKIRWLSLGVALAILTADAIAIAHHSASTTAVEFLGALGVLTYLVVRRGRLRVPRWAIAAVLALGLIGFVALTPDGKTLRGQYHGSDQSNVARDYEAHQVRNAVFRSPVSLVIGRGLGATIDETRAPPDFRKALVTSGRDLAQVPEVHLLAYNTLLKQGFLGLAWLAALCLGILLTAGRALERAAQSRDPSFVIYAALPLLGLMAGFASASHLQANPLNGLALGLLVTCLGRRAPAPHASINRESSRTVSRVNRAP